jgi:hypothetical protein
VSVHGALLDVVIDDNSDLPSVSSLGSESPYYTNQSRSDNFSSMQMLGKFRQNLNFDSPNFLIEID